MRYRRHVCDGDCFNCPYPDCILSGVEAAAMDTADYRRKSADAARHRRDYVGGKHEAYYEANTLRYGAFGAKIRDARTMRGIKQYELAKMLGVSQTTISLWELGKMPCDKEAICTVMPELREDS